MLSIRPTSPREVRQQLQSLRSAFEEFFAHRAGDSDDELAAAAKASEIYNDVDPLVWWKENADQTPAIKHLPRIVFSVPASSATSEREFSSAGVNSTAGRARLDSDKVEMLSVLRSVMKAMGLSNSL